MSETWKTIPVVDELKETRRQLAEANQNHLPQMSALAGAIADERDENRRLKTELAEANAELKQAIAARDANYAQRNKLNAALAEAVKGLQEMADDTISSAWGMKSKARNTLARIEAKVQPDTAPAEGASDDQR